jgi:hypothetical protein
MTRDVLRAPNQVLRYSPLDLDKQSLVAAPV